MWRLSNIPTRRTPSPSRLLVSLGRRLKSFWAHVVSCPVLPSKRIQKIQQIADRSKNGIHGFNFESLANSCMHNLIPEEYRLLQFPLY